jgi:predicted RNA-binding Zn ribbon-like protein
MAERNLDGAIERFLRFDLDGGQLCLDFTNTVDWRNTDKQHEWLNEYQDLLAWGVRVGLLEREVAQRLEQRAAEEPDQARAVLRGARELRELLFRIFNTVIEGGIPGPEDWRAFNKEVQSAMGSAVIEAYGGGFAWSFGHEMGSLEFYRGSVLKAAADLLLDGDRSRLKRCGTPDCQWLFLDTSKNNSRKWCDMQSCGNRAKAKRFYQKSRYGSGR